MMKLIDVLKQYRVTSPYGLRLDPFGSGRMVPHTGIDLAGKEVNDPVEAFLGGKVIYSNDTHPGTGLGGFGWVVMVADEYGYGHMYAHLQKDSLKVKVGQKIVDGQELGIMGSTGKSTGRHLHWEVRDRISPSYGYTHDTDPGGYIIKIMQKRWLYADSIKNQILKDEAHEVAEFIRKNWLR